MTKNILLLLWWFFHVSSCWEFSIQIDKCRVEFINTEDNLWHYWKDYTYVSSENANQEVKHLMQKMASFDKQNLNKVSSKTKIILNYYKFKSVVASKAYLRRRTTACYQEVHGVTEGARTDQRHVQQIQTVS